MKDLNSINFEGREPTERIIMLLRRHKVALGKQVFEFFGGAALLIAVYFLLQRYTEWFNDTASIGYGSIVIAISLILLYLLLFIYHAWVDYYLDMWIITDQRIIATDQQGLFHRTTSELRLDKIQDVSSQTQGPLATVFKYGTVQVRTASEEDKFFFADVARPEIVAREILELHEHYVASGQSSNIRGVHQQSTIDHQSNEGQSV